MKQILTRILAFALTMVLLVGLIPMVSADEDVRIRETAYSETQGLRVAMTGKVADPDGFVVTVLRGI